VERLYYWERPAEQGSLLQEIQRSSKGFVPFRVQHGQTIPDVFRAVAANYGDHVAVKGHAHSFTYSELETASNAIAAAIVCLTAGRQASIALFLEHDATIVACILGILKAGSVYVPLDPGLTGTRNSVIVRDSSASVVFSERKNLDAAKALFGSSCRIVDIERTITAFAQPLNVHSYAHDNACVTYTSGSTGRPRGVVHTHATVLQVAKRYVNCKAIAPGDRVTLLYSSSVAASLGNIFGPILSGATLLPFNVRARGFSALADWLTDERITVFHSSPALFRSAFENPGSEILPDLRIVRMGGDMAYSSDFEIFKRIANDDCAMVNAYGCSEISTVCCFYLKRNSMVSEPILPVGCPIDADAEVVVLNESGNPVRAGAVGEIAVRSPHLSPGYWPREEAKEEIHRDGDRVRVYRTGDIGKMAGGYLLHQGRKDSQIKIRGYRIELVEVESTLRSHPEVKAAAVISKNSSDMERCLAAYVVPQTGSNLTVEALSKFSADYLPEYMRPAVYVLREYLPQTEVGKLDRAALTALPLPERGSAEYQPPQTANETVLAGLWAELFNRTRISRLDNFFQLGGHSLLAIRLLGRLRQALGVDLAFKDLFFTPVLADLARHLEKAPKIQLTQVLAIRRADGGASIPLSFAQQRLWFLAQMEGGKEAYHMGYALRLRGPLDRAALGRALDHIVHRHEALRTTFVVNQAGHPEQQVAAAQGSTFQLAEDDLRLSQEKHATGQRLRMEEFCSPFDLKQGPLIRGRLIRYGDDDYTLLIAMHHIVSDGWSVGVLMQELSLLYGNFVTGQAAALPPLPLQYPDYAIWQRKQMEAKLLADQAAYWKSNLEGVPEALELPADHPRPLQQSFAGAFTELVLDRHMTAELKQLSRRHGTTLYMTLLAGWVALLARLSGQHDVVVGTPSANRGRIEIESLIGFFVNTLALRFDLSGSPTVAELLERVKRQALAAQQHQEIAFEQVVEIVRPVRSVSHTPLFQTMFAWQNVPRRPPALHGLDVGPIESAPHVRSKFDLMLTLRESEDRIVGGVEYATSLFEQPTMGRYVSYYRLLLQSMLAAQETEPVERLPILGTAERNQLLYEWNNTATPDRPAYCVHELFEEQVKKTPDAIALYYRSESLSYQELNRRANRLAHHLRSIGVTPDSCVAICLPRGCEMVLGMLGIMKAGGAFVPLDPGYPVEQLRHLLRDSSPVALLTRPELKTLFPEKMENLVVIESGSGAAEWADNPESNPERNTCSATSQNLAYVMYTSGSTGAPKGVAVQHASLVNYLLWTTSVLLNGIQRLPAITSFSFDPCLKQLVSPLIVGETVIILDRVLENPTVLLDIMSSGTSAINCVPSVWRDCLDFLETNPSCSCNNLARVLLGGEKIAPELLARCTAILPRTRISNLYGPTETTANSVVACSVTVNDICIGSPIANTEVYVCDEQMELVPPGVAGELFIGGAGVARGYLKRPDLTAEKFVPNPFRGSRAGRIYRTGDKVRWRRDGALEFLGRDDHQVKIRGCRVELGEIESRLLEHPSVREVVVVAREDAAGEKRLVAYFTCQSSFSDDESLQAKTEDSSTASSLWRHVSARLPEHMVPAAYICLPALPLTPNGKLDRKALPEPREAAYAQGRYEEPQGSTEKALASIWSELLKVERVGRSDNFFQLGGHSLLAVRMISQVSQKLKIQATVSDVFACPILRSFADRIIERSLDQYEAADLAPMLRLLQNSNSV
jgi:amino acid adenylation domain-containing protein